MYFLKLILDTFLSLANFFLGFFIFKNIAGAWEIPWALEISLKEYWFVFIAYLIFVSHFLMMTIYEFSNFRTNKKQIIYETTYLKRLSVTFLMLFLWGYSYILLFVFNLVGI